MTTPPPYVPIAGLLVPTPLVPRIIAAVRGLYPTVTEGLEDDAAVRAWLKHIVGVTLANFEAMSAQAPVAEAVEVVRADYAERAEQAREQALTAAASIQESETSTPVVL